MYAPVALRASAQQNRTVAAVAGQTISGYRLDQ